MQYVLEYNIEERKIDKEEREIKEEINKLRENNPWYPINHLTGKLASVSVRRKNLLKRRKLAALKGYYV